MTRAAGNQVADVPRQVSKDIQDALLEVGRVAIAVGMKVTPDDSSRPLGELGFGRIANLSDIYM